MDDVRQDPKFKTKKNLLLGLAYCLTFLQTALCQCPLGSTSFEKVAGSSLRGTRMTPLYKGTPGEPSITKECLERCRSLTDCNSMLLSYTAMNCMKSPMTSEGRRTDVTPSSPPSSTSYFEKICLSAPRCDRLWTFERVIGYEISGFDHRTIPGVASRLQCEELCLREQGFACRSGEYDYAFQQCRLSSEDRRSQPSSYRPAFGDVDYFENQCVSDGSSGCSYEEKPDTDLEHVDASMSANSVSECQQQCDATQTFLCHAYSYREPASTCKLSSDDTFNLGSSAVRRRMGTSYFQRSNCLDLKLTCTDTSMVLVLRTREPFDGRIYSQNKPYACQVYGDKQTVTKFAMDVKGQCGVELEGEDHLTNTVVIQYHPLIQQKGDRVIKLYCSLFEEQNRTVTKTFRVAQGLEPAVTAVVNATAPTPNIRLRITDINGTDITGTKIGEPLYFRIEIDEDSVFGIFARDMTARNGRGDLQITLLDGDGCSADPRIFPHFEKIPGTKSLQSRFQAFKFSEDPVVRFQVNVHFCLEECNPIICPGGVQSFGKRRKREDMSEIPIVPDYPLVAAIVVQSASYGNDTGPTDSQYIEEKEREMSDELVCTTKTVVVVSSLGALFLQIGLLAACGTCLLLTRKEHKPRYNEDAASTITETLPPFGSETHHSRFR
ncbi:uncharacterized protein LOC129223837 isoform X2 [Uloborus diversus]|uniref:uncharacterized protein LOC129223837 isoform X2 n=1 Tax=Uloborus diversus TaxID=327109 RepID=UPI00240A2270|nr:uncharacterized protein LOC129223837 isoform X2 [Uloborus diversus]XP_054714175.1 uncharacterized protein LOC129223837 isoform X2 [Uloborus diversus]